MNRSGDRIVIRGARQHNLKNIDLEIPRNRLVVITGVSGSGKSSLAFDTLYAESQRRYLESFSAYARRFFQRFDPPEVDLLLGLSPAIAIEHKTLPTNPRSTVGTLTEIADHLRLLFTHLGTVTCPACHQAIIAHPITQMIKEVMQWPVGSRILILAPLGAMSRKSLAKAISSLRRDGYARVRIDRDMYMLDSPVRLRSRPSHELEVVIDRIILKPGQERRLGESLELAAALADGQVKVIGMDMGEMHFSERFQCLQCGYRAKQPSANLFSFTHPEGACSHCHGLGFVKIPDVDQKALQTLDQADETIPCPACAGSRFNQAARTVKLGGLGIHEVFALPVPEVEQWLQSLRLSTTQRLISRRPRHEITRRLKVMQQLGLGYLSLDRSAPSLSTGEVQRIRLARQLNASLSGVLYVLDEPSIGLHVRDHHRLLNILRELRDLGNTVIVVEHDLDTLRQADHVVDMGPHSGSQGGEVIFSGKPADLVHHPSSITAQFLSGRKSLGIPPRRAPFSSGALTIEKARGRNLQDLTVSFPLACLTCVTGVSGSGKSTLILDTLQPALERLLHGATKPVQPFARILGYQHLAAVRAIDHSPIGRSPKSTPATYTGIFQLIRRLFAQLPEARARGYSANRFSFNVKKGRCEACKGEGVQRIEMDFLPDVFVTCPACNGSRYRGETLDIRFKGKSIADVLNLPVAEALLLFENLPSIRRKLAILQDVGLGYLRLGQSATELSSGEAQRIKLARELAHPARKATLYIMDEPTTGLHLDDIQKLMDVVQRLINSGHTVIMIEHQPEIMKMADYVIDLGPEGGPQGGCIIAQGTPEEVAGTDASYTGQVLARLLGFK